MIKLAAEYAERTRVYFQRDVFELAGALQNKEVRVPGTEIRVVLTRLLPYRISENQKAPWYKLVNMEPGELYVPFVQGNRVPVIPGLERGERGACIKLHRAVSIEDGREIPLTTSKIATRLQLSPNEDPRPYLTFMDGSETLWVARGEVERAATLVKPRPEIPSERANELMRGLTSL